MRIAVLGSGFGGSLAARVLTRLGHRVVLVEKGRHPRFALGESSTPLANLGLERLAARYDLPDLHHLAAYGRWLRHLPGVHRGLKRGFTFYHHEPGRGFPADPDAPERALVAASPEDALADSHWLRADVDLHLVQRAREEGVEVREEHAVEEIARTPGGSWEIRGRRGSQGMQPFSLEADFLIDATGPAGVVPRALGIAEVSELSEKSPERGGLVTRSALVYGHFRGVRRFEEIAREIVPDLPPGSYPDDAAAVHHLLGEGWMYVLRFDPEGPGGEPEAEAGATVSAGILFEGGLPEGTPAELWQEVLARYPALAAQFAGAEPLRPLLTQGRVQHRWARAVGEGWLALPHTYAFVDPLFSTGIAWTVLGVERLGRLFEGDGDGARYDERLRAEVERIDRLVRMAYRARGSFRAFVAVGLLYFAAVSFAESRRRLVDPAEDPGADDPWEGFLGVGDPVLDALFDKAPARLEKALGSGEVAPFEEWVRQGIAPRNVAGLADPERRNLYPVDLEALVNAAPLLGLTPDQVRERLHRLRTPG